MTKDQAKVIIEKLVNRYTEQQKAYHAADYNETKTRRDFIDHFFKALGWDMDNEQDVAEPYREVIHEDKVKIQGKVKAPDYGFRLQGAKDRLFFVEAKKPSVALKTNKEAAFQVRRYGWNSRVAVSILTNFEEFIVYDCSKKPNANDSTSVARLKTITYDQFLQEFDFIYDTFSREAVVKGRFDTYVKSDTAKKGTVTPDKDFVNSLEEWRRFIAIDIARNNLKLNEDELNFAVQLIIDRLIFLRFCEDRGVEHYGQLKSAVAKGSAYEQLHDIFIAADDKYNSGLFDFDKDKITQGLKVTSKVIKGIIDDMYYPLSQYDFKALPVEVLGNAYEQFLGKVIRINKAHHAVIEEKPEVRKAGGVFYTPQYIVDYIVENTVGKLIAGKTPKEIEKIKIVDPACGSGSFLLGAFDYLLKFHQNYYHQNPPSAKSGIITPIGTLSTAEKKKILLNNIYGVDLDANAVEVSKLSLLLKCMEGETEASIKQQITMFNERVLPDLDNNIKDGNSLIDTDIYDSELDFGEEKKIKPFSWKKAFPDVFKQEGFDAVIGNPPYVMSEIEDVQKKYLTKKYKFQEGKPDLYRYFVEFSQSLLNSQGYFSFIIPNSILSIPSCKSLRKFLIQTSGSIDIVNFWGQVFDKVSINNIILTTKKKGKLKHITIVDDKSNKPTSNTLKEASDSASTKNIQDILNNENYVFTVTQTSDSDSILEKITSGSIKVSEVCSYTLGMQVYHNTMHKKSDIENRIYHSVTKKDKTFFQESGGTNVKRYHFIEKYGEYVSYGDWCYNKPDWKFCTKERILIREIPSKSGLVCCLTDKTHVPNKAIIIVIAEKTTNQFLLGVLNSKLMGYYVFNSTEKGKQRLFPRVSLTTIRNLPFKEKPNAKLKAEIEKNVSLISELYSELALTNLQSKQALIIQRIEHAEDKINQLVYELYELTPEEIAIIEASTSK